VLLGIYLNDLKTYTHTKAGMRMFIAALYDNCQQLKTSATSFNRERDKQTVVLIDNDV
jgi:hypothetical protein